MAFFIFKKLDPNESLFPELFKLRYKIYIEEWKFEKPEDHPDGTERDIFDDYALHLAAIPSKDPCVIGTTRMIFDSDNGFPVEKHMKITKDISDIPRNKICEISRLCVRNDYTKRREDEALTNPYSTDPPFDPPEEIKNRRKKENDIVFGLIKCLAKESRINEFTHWYVAMARSLHILLKRKGIVFEEAGPEIDYHGFRRPYFGSIDEILKGNDDLHEIYTGESDFSYEAENS